LTLVSRRAARLTINIVVHVGRNSATRGCIAQEDKRR
jgi:hypothetical protein